MTEKINDGGPAFPVAEDHKVAADLQWTQGMSLRDWFAGQALPQAVEDYDRRTRAIHDTKVNVLPYATAGAGTRTEIIAQQAYKYADAMLAARQRAEAEDA